GARLHRPLPLDRTGTGEDRFEQRGLAALEWAHQRNAPGTPWTIAALSHLPPPRRWCLPPTGPSASPRAIVSGRGRTGKGTGWRAAVRMKSARLTRGIAGEMTRITGRSAARARRCRG